MAISAIWVFCVNRSVAALIAILKQVVMKQIGQLQYCANVELRSFQKQLVNVFFSFNIKTMWIILKLTSLRMDFLYRNVNMLTNQPLSLNRDTNLPCTELRFLVESQKISLLIGPNILKSRYTLVRCCVAIMKPFKTQDWYDSSSSTSKIKYNFKNYNASTKTKFQQQTAYSTLAVSETPFHLITSAGTNW